ncbi:hypothetical protein QD460_13905 [Rhizobium jaguaris]|uniref:hypothetical protein n=1 Tax=Rhizobium jaguaris TaxID=1312183 RepID=UPI0039BFAFB2
MVIGVFLTAADQAIGAVILQYEPDKSYLHLDHITAWWDRFLEAIKTPLTFKGGDFR